MIVPSRRLIVATAAALLAAVSLGAAPTPVRGEALNRPFVRGGWIRLNLSAGDYAITGTPDSRIRVSYRIDRDITERSRTVGATLDLHGSGAAVLTTAKAGNGVHYAISIPSRADIDVDLGAGNLKIAGVEGSKTVSSWAGNVRIDVGAASLYKEVDASVRVGDLNAPAFHVSKGGLLRSFYWTGGGRYALTVKLFAGDLILR